MSIFLAIIVGLPIFNLTWWAWADQRLRRSRGAGWRGARGWRIFLALFAGANLVLFVYVLAARLLRWPPLPKIVLAEVYIWHLVVLPATVLTIGIGQLVRLLAAFGRRLRSSATAPSAPDDRESTAQTAASLLPTPQPALSRRNLLTMAAVAVPPLALAASEVRAFQQLSGFRIRRLEIPLTGLPSALAGMRIVHISDTHVGRFTYGAILDDIVARTKDLQPDLIVFTGDLIDHDLLDLPAGIDMLKRMPPNVPLFVCEGNHDLFEGHLAFEQRVLAAGLPLLLNQSALVSIRGVSVQVLGLRWGRPGVGRGAAIDQQIAELLPQIRRDAFPILLAHHPHAFDPAAAAGIPLTLSGHTHGGQLMLTPEFGAGTLLFKYISGLYRRGPSALVVSNGAGNWLPLRINAPAEIGLLTLRSAEPPPR